MADEFGGPVLAFSRDSKFTFEDYDDVSPSTKPWLIKNAWPMRGVVFIAGASGAAKTFFALDALLKVAGGAESIWGRRSQPRAVVYVAAEDPDGCRARVKAFRSTKGAKAAEAGVRKPFKLVPQAPNLLDPGDVDDFIASTRLVADGWTAEGSELGVVCLDTFSVCIPGTDENNSADMSQALEALYRVSRELGVLVVVVAHFGKSGTTGGIRGWSGLGYNADGVIVIERDEEDKELRHVTFQKVKNGASGGRLDFTLKEVNLGLIDDAGDPMTSCIVSFHSPAPEAPSRRKKTAQEKPGPKIVLRALTQLLETGQNTYVVPPVPGVPPNTVGVERKALRERAATIGHSSKDLKPETAKRMINRDIADLIADGTIREEDDIIWRVR